jgi:hypothetical protein
LVTAGGAVLVAGVGVYAVFQMAFWIAGSTGRSLNGEASRPKIASAASNSTERSNGSPTVASPLEKLALNANLNPRLSLRLWRDCSSGVSDEIASELARLNSVR